MLLAYVMLWTTFLVVGSVIFVHVVAAVLAFCEILYNIIFNRDKQ